MKNFGLIAILFSIGLAPFAYAEDSPVGLWKISTTKQASRKP